ncbi:hypothetical protein [Yoonia sp.]|uniref:hypothetical protein n=1 Tax=Yoonia sp. TaxID=2212373 RepID=UPI00391BB73C
MPHRPADCDVIILRCHDKLLVDRPVLMRAFEDRTPAAAEDMLCRILESIAHWLDVLQDGAEDPDRAVKAARRIVSVAGPIGLTGLALAADDVGQCLQSGDRVALAATTGRLERAFDLAVAELWDFRGL